MKIFLCSIILILMTSACKPQQEKRSSPGGYNLQQPERFSLPESLLEVSGIAFRNGDGDTIFAIQDEDGRLFRLAWNDRKQKNVSFAASGDYEDVTIMGNRVFILKSNGNIYSFLLAGATGKKVAEVTESKKLLPSGEYEGMFYDSLTNKLIVLCKECKADKKSKTITGYALDHESGKLEFTGEFTIDYNSQAEKNIIKGNLKPSALARHPLTKQWYILSSVNKLVLIVNDNWAIQEIHPLSSKVFNQPEGIAFDKSGNLYISNEGDEITEGNILKFVYKP